MPRKFFGRKQPPSRTRAGLRGFDLERLEARLLMAAFVVKSTGDNPDAGSLRWAITQVLSSGSLGQISFDIPGGGPRVIQLSSALPAISVPIVIDGTTQPGYAGVPLIQIDGSSLSPGSIGLELRGGVSSVRGLAISGLRGTGIMMVGAGGNLIQGNYIGIDPAGTKAVPNFDGIQILDSSSNTIGGTSVGLGNVISGNAGDGIRITRVNQDATGNVITGNLVGTTADGLRPLGNQGNGISIEAANGNLVGGNGGSQGNIVSGNMQDGIRLTRGAQGNLIHGNLIGTSVDALSTVGNRHDGISLDDAPGNMIGGLAPGMGNLISGNLGNGIETRNQTNGLLVVGNLIGTDLSGTTGMGNQGNGIRLASSGNTIGGVSNGASNTIAYNGTGLVGSGVQLVGIVNRNSILSNSIFNNAGLGINLGNGPTPNQPPDSPPGPNDWQNYPVFSIARTDGSSTQITGILTGAPSTTYLVQLFSNPTADPSGFGEGKLLFASINSKTDGSGIAHFDQRVGVGSNPGNFLSATATDSLGNTSEFSADLQIQSVTDLKVTISASPSPCISGDNVTYVVSVSNSGQLDAHNVVLTDQTPGSTKFMEASASQGNTPNPNGTTITSALGTIPAGATATLTVVVQTRPGFTGTITNTASVTMNEVDSSPADNSASITTRVSQGADLALVMTVDDTPLHVGQTLTYTLTATNLGPGPATRVVVAMPSVTGIGFVSANSNQGAVVLNNGQLTASIGSLSPGSTATIAIIARALEVGTFSEKATISADEADPVSGNNSATATAVVLPQAELAIAVSANVDVAASGRDLTYTVRVVNNGPDPADQVILRDILPDDVEFDSATSDAGGSPSLANGVVTAVIGFLPVGVAATLVVTVRVSAPVGAILTNTASATAWAGEPAETTRTKTIDTPVRVVSDLAVQVTPSVRSSPIGQQLTYMITVENRGPAEDPDVMVLVPLPAGIDLVSAQSSQGGAPVKIPGQVSADLGPLPSGARALLTLIVRPESSPEGPLELGARVHGFNADIDPSNNADSATVAIDPAADLSLLVSPPTTLAYLGQDIVYTVMVTNQGPSSASGVMTKIPVPSSSRLVSAIASQGIVTTTDTNQINAAMGTIPSGGSASVKMIVHPSQSSIPSLLLAAAVTGDTFDPDPKNNQSASSITVDPAVNFSIGLSVTSNTAVTGRPLSFTASVVNTGASTATGVALVFPILGQASFVGANSTQGKVQAGEGGVVALLGDLPAGVSAAVTIVVIPAHWGTMSWQATVRADQFDLGTQHGQASILVNVLDSPGTIQFATSSVTVDETAGYAMMPVVRTGGALGAVAVRYQTASGNATEGVDYVPISGILTFADGQTTQLVTVPLLPNPHDRSDEHLWITIDSPTAGAILGAQSRALVTIRDLDPDLVPPRVSDLSWAGTASQIDRITIGFSEPLLASAAVDIANFRLIDLGSSGSFGALDNRVVPLGQAAYDPVSRSVILTPGVPLPSGRFYRIELAGATSGGLRDLAGNPLAGVENLFSGADYVALFGQGTTLKYADSNGDLVTLKITGPGSMNQIRNPNGEGAILRLVGVNAKRTILSGTLKRPKRGGDGTTSLGTIEGLGQFGEIRVKLASPIFKVAHYPFFMRQGRALPVTSP